MKKTKLTIDNNHQYRLHTNDGSIIPLTSVSTLMERYFHATDFIDFIDDTRLEELREKGTRIHKILEDFDKGNNDETKLKKAEHQILKKWKSIMPRAQYIEQSIYCLPIRLAGTPDRIYIDDEGQFRIIEIKTGKYCPQHEMQTGAYRHILQTDYILKNFTPPHIKETLVYIDTERANIYTTSPAITWKERQMAIEAAIEIEKLNRLYIKREPETKVIDI